MLDEGLFRSDKNQRNIYGKSKSEVETKAQKFLQDFKDFNPKAGKISTDEYGRFFVPVTYYKQEGGDNKLKAGFNKTLGALKTGKEVIKKVASNIPRQETITAKNKSALTAKINKIKTESPDARFGKIKTDENGMLSVTVLRKKVSSPAQPAGNRVSNIQKQLAKLSGDKLDRIEKIVNESNNNIRIDITKHFKEALEMKNRCHDKSHILKKMEIVKERLPKMKAGKYKVWGMYPDRSRKYWAFIAKWNPNVPEVAFVTYLSDEMGKEPITNNYDHKLQL